MDEWRSRQWPRCRWSFSSCLSSAPNWTTTSPSAVLTTATCSWVQRPRSTTTSSGQDRSHPYPQWRVRCGWRSRTGASVSPGHRLYGIPGRQGTGARGPDYPRCPAIPRLPRIRRRPVCTVPSPQPRRPGPCHGLASLETSTAVTPFHLPFPARNPSLPGVALRYEGTMFACRTDPDWDLGLYRDTHC